MKSNHKATTNKPTTTKVLKVTGMSYGGRGVARDGGKVYFVRDGLPGDTVRAAITKEKKSFGEGYVTAITQPSALRSPSPCRFSKDCGGCQWLEAPLELQEAWKKDFIITALRKADISCHSLDDFFSSPKSNHYRNRSQFKLSLRGKKLTIGFFKEKSRDIVSVDTCFIVDKSINQALRIIKQLEYPESIVIESGSLEIQHSLDNQIIINLTVSKFVESKNTSTFIETLQKALPIALVSFNHSQSEPSFIYDKQNEFQYKSAPGQFQQINIAGNHKLRDIVKELVSEINPGFILDLFCGSGNLCLQLAENNRELLGVELSESAIALADENAKINHVDRIEFVSKDSLTFLKNYKLPDKKSLVICDPPRAGLLDTAQLLQELKPHAIIYISCDPNTFARDAKVFVDGGYVMKRVYGFDFFPHTYHVETCGLFELS